MAEVNKYINDYRNLLPYYDLVFKIMADVAKFSFERDIIKVSRSMRELIINTAPYILKPEQKLEELVKHLSGVLTDEYFKPNKSKEQLLKIEKSIDDYLFFINKMRIEIHENLTKTGLLPKNFIDNGKPAVVKYANEVK